MQDIKKLGDKTRDKKNGQIRRKTKKKWGDKTGDQKKWGDATQDKKNREMKHKKKKMGRQD